MMMGEERVYVREFEKVKREYMSESLKKLRESNVREFEKVRREYM